MLKYIEYLKKICYDRGIIVAIYIFGGAKNNRDLQPYISKANGGTKMTSLTNSKALKIAVIFIGMANSGKTEFYNRYFSDIYTHIELSVLRTRLKERSALNECFAHGDSFVINNENPTKADRQRYIPSAKEAGYRIVGYYFDSTAEPPTANTSKAKEKAKYNAYIKFKDKMQTPCYDEGFDELYCVHMSRSGDFHTEKINKE